MNQRIVGRLVGVSFALLLLLGGPGMAAEIQLTDVTIPSGLAGFFYYTNTNHALGLNWIDFNNDDWPDLFLVNGYDNDPHLYQNVGGTFVLKDELLPELPNYELMGSVYADYDNDGDSDIYIFTDTNQFTKTDTNPIDGPPNLFLKSLFVENGNRVIPGQPLYEEIAVQAGVDDLAETPFGDLPGYRSPSGAFLDYDRDGFVDLYVGHWAVSHPYHDANMDRFYRNNGDGTFTDVTARALYKNGDQLKRRPALVVVGAHLDDDLWPDLYVGNIWEIAPNHIDHLYRNSRSGKFYDVRTKSSGLGDDAAAAMGVTVGDIDLDGDWDLYVSDLYKNYNNPNNIPCCDEQGNPAADVLPLGNPFYLSLGNGQYTDNVAIEAGIQSDSSWGVNFFDIDQDGYEDLFVTTTHAKDDVFRNNGDGTFTNVKDSSGIPEVWNGRGSAVADYDRDGDLDLAVVYKNSVMRLFRNDTVAPGNWFQVKLNASISNRSAIGTLVRLNAGRLTMMRQVMGGTSAHGQDSGVLHFGLGDAVQVDQLEVHWPSGLVSIHTNLPAGQVFEVSETLESAPPVEAAGSSERDTPRIPRSAPRSGR